MIIQRARPWLVTVAIMAELLTAAALGRGEGRFASRGKACATYIGADQCGLITPMNFGTLLTGTLLYAGVLPLQPGLHGLGVLFVGPLDGLLRRKAPAPFLCNLTTCLRLWWRCASVRFRAFSFSKHLGVRRLEKVHISMGRINN